MTGWAALFAAFVGGWFAHAGWLHRRARLDFTVLAYLHRYGPSWYTGLEFQGVGGATLPARLRRLVRMGLVAERLNGAEGYSITDLGEAWLCVEVASNGAGTPDKEGQS